VYVWSRNLSNVTSQVTDSPGPFLFLANHQALDLLNTALIQEAVPVERLTDFGALVAWLEQAGLVVPEDAKQARARWEGTPEGEATATRARTLRELLRKSVQHMTSAGTLPSALLTKLNGALREEIGVFAELARTQAQTGFQRRMRLSLEAPGNVLAPLLRAVASLFVEVDFALVRKCEDPTCVLFFYDVSKNHARRWCSMEVCGNRHKVNAYRSRGTRGA